MAEIHLLPMLRDSGNAYRQLHVLSKAFSDKVDLGPRCLHIQADGRELGALSVELKQQLDELQTLPGAEAPVIVTLLDQMQELAELLEELSGLTRTFTG